MASFQARDTHFHRRHVRLIIWSNQTNKPSPEEEFDLYYKLRNVQSER